MLSDSSHYHVSTVESGQVGAVLLMLRWPRGSQFPLFDLLRLLAIHPHGAQVLASHPLRADLQTSLIALLGIFDFTVYLSH